MSDRRALTPEDVAERWGCSASHVRRLIANGELPAFRLGGKLIRIRPQDVEAYECPNTDCNASVEDGPSLSTTTDAGSAENMVWSGKPVLAFFGTFLADTISVEQCRDYAKARLEWAEQGVAKLKAELKATYRDGGS